MSFLQGLFGPPDIGKMQARSDIEGLVKALGYEKVAAVRQAAALALGQIGDARAVEPLISALKDSDKAVHQAAAEALGMIGDTRAVKALISTLKDSDRYERQVAIGALIKTGESAVKPLISALRDNYVRDDVVIDALVKIGKPAVEPLITALKDVSKVVREVAAEALGKIGDPYGVEPLIATLKDKHKYVRRAAAEALDRLGWFPGEDENGASYWVAKKHWDKCIEISTLAVEPLIMVLNGDDQVVRGVAAEALGIIGDARAVEPLIAALHNSDDNDGRSVAAEALVKIGKPAVEPLIAELGDDNYVVRETAAQALGKIGDARAVEPIMDVHRCHYLRGEVTIGALVKIGEPSVEPLIAALADYDWTVRPAVVEALVKIGKPAIEPLISALGDRKKDVRKSAVELLDRLGWWPDEDGNGARYWAAKEHWDQCVEIGKPAVEPLMDALHDHDKDVRKGAAYALVKIGEPAKETLIATLHDNDKDVRKMAAEALDQLGWWPHEDENGASYWIEKKRLDKCIGIGKPAIAPLLRWLFQTPQELDSLAQIGDTRLFGDYTDLILEASSYGPCSETYWDEGSWPSEEIRHTHYDYSLACGDNAINRLCISTAPVASNLLHLVADKNDVSVVMFHDSGSEARCEMLSFADQRQRARDELKARGDPLYDPKLYLQEGVWDLPLTQTTSPTPSPPSSSPSSSLSATHDIV